MAGLIFDWPLREWFSWRLLAFVGVSIGIHGLAFVLFQVVERDRATHPALEKEVVFLSWEVPGHQALLSQVEAESPTALLSHPLLPTEPELRPRLRSVVPARTPKLAVPQDPDSGGNGPVFPLWVGGGGR
jgi:hypothetical protein